MPDRTPTPKPRIYTSVESPEDFAARVRRGLADRALERAMVARDDKIRQQERERIANLATEQPWRSSGALRTFAQHLRDGL